MIYFIAGMCMLYMVGVMVTDKPNWPWILIRELFRIQIKADKIGLNFYRKSKKNKTQTPYEETYEYVEVLALAKNSDLAFPHDPYIPWEQKLENARKLIESAPTRLTHRATCRCHICIPNENLHTLNCGCGFYEYYAGRYD